MYSSQFKNNHFTEMCCGTEGGSYLRLIDSCITQLKAQGPSRTCNESKEEEEEVWKSRVPHSHVPVTTRDPNRGKLLTLAVVNLDGRARLGQLSLKCRDPLHRKQKCFRCSPFYGRACRWAVLGELKPKGPEAPPNDGFGMVTG